MSHSSSQKFLKSKLNYCNQEVNIVIKPGIHGPQAELARDFVIFLVRVHGSLDKAYHDDVWLDHACPFTIRASTRIPVHRVPNVVGVGLAKCGTGTLAFLGKFWVESNPNSPHFGRTPISPSLHPHFIPGIIRYQVYFRLPSKNGLPVYRS